LGRYAKLWLPALLLAAVLILASCGGAGTGENQQGGSDDNMQGMNHGDESGDQKTTRAMAGMDHDQMGHGGMASGMVMENGRYSDERFIDAMVPHHQGAVEMARVALENAEHEEIRELSRNIISTQHAEIEELKSIKKEEFGSSKVPMEMSQEQMQAMGMMMDPEQLAHSDPFDKAFIDAMIPHHQSAIEMAKVAYQKSENPRIKELAQNIMGAQQREIDQMNEWRREWYPEG
jgi:uncharacterized protein (DUF305 family)